MSPQRVLVIAEDSLFINGIEMLIARQPGLESVGTVPADVGLITAQIERTTPNVVIINDDLATANDQLVLALLKAFPDLRIIAISLEENRINVYDNRAVKVTTADDLIAAITGKRA